MKGKKEIEKRRNYLIDENIKLARKINNTHKSSVENPVFIPVNSRIHRDQAIESAYGKDKYIAIFCEHNKMIKTLEWVLED